MSVHFYDPGVGDEVKIETTIEPYDLVYYLGLESRGSLFFVLQTDIFMRECVVFVIFCVSELLKKQNLFYGAWIL